MQVKSGDLPGVGRRYSFTTLGGDRLVVILHQGGQREIYHFAETDEDDPDLVIKMTDEEARQFGTILVGVDYQPVSDERMEMLLKNIRLEWVPVAPGSELVDRTILESQVRAKTGATIIGIQRGDQIIGSPEAKEVIRAGDVLMIVGKRDQTRKMESLCEACRRPAAAHRDGDR